MILQKPLALHSGARPFSKEGRAMKRKRKFRKPRTNLDTHHIFWTRRSWNHGPARDLRDFWYCKIQIPREGLHHHIHEEVFKIPVPCSGLIEDCLLQLQMLEKANAIHDDDPIKKRLEILICCLDTGDSPTAEALKAQLEAVKAYKPE